MRENERTTGWSRVHARQALVLGVTGSAVFIVVLALPLITVLAVPGLSSGATIGIYGGGLLADIIVAAALAVVTLRCAARAARGELFAIPLVGRVADRWLRGKGR